MHRYAPPAYRPAAPPSGQGPYVRPVMGETFDQMFGWQPWVGDAVRLAFHGGTAYLGARVGLEEGGSAIGVLAWILAVGNGIAGVCDAVSLLERAAGTHPPGAGEPCLPTLGPAAEGNA